MLAGSCAGGLGDGRLYVLRGRVDVAVERELNRDCVAPCVFVELIVWMPAMVENWRSSGVATEDAIVSGLAPGSAALTWMVG